MDIVSLHHLPLGGILSPRCIQRGREKTIQVKAMNKSQGKRVDYLPLHLK